MIFCTTVENTLDAYGHWGSLVAQLVKNPPALQEILVQPWVRKIPWRRKWLPTLVFLPGKSHG